MIEPQKFKKRPVVIEAMRLPEPYPEGVDPSSDGYQKNLDAMRVVDWLIGHLGEGYDPIQAEIHGDPKDGWSIDPEDGSVLIATLEGVMKAKPGDWVVRGVVGEFYPVRDDIFRETYEEAS